MPVTCSGCHIEVRETDYFCFNCGKNLKPKPPSKSILSQFGLYIGSVFLPPMGIIWGIKYLKQEDNGSKLIGLVAIGLTLISLVVTVMVSINLVNSINSQVGSQLQDFGGF